MWSFIAHVLRQAWKYGVAAVRAAADYVRRHWGTVQRWIERFGYAEALRMILEILGYL